MSKVPQGNEKLDHLTFSLVVKKQPKKPPKNLSPHHFMGKLHHIPLHFARNRKRSEMFMSQTTKTQIQSILLWFRTIIHQK